jgi:ketosteroid isomerase-like protein
MSRRNAELLQRAYDALGRGDMQLLEGLWRRHLVPGFELHSFMLGQVFRGMDGLRDFLAEVRGIFEDYVLEAAEIIDLGDDVVVVQRMSGRGGGSGVPVTEQFATVWSFAGDPAVNARAEPPMGGTCTWHPIIRRSAGSRCSEGACADADRIEESPAAGGALFGSGFYAPPLEKSWPRIAPSGYLRVWTFT